MFVEIIDFFNIVEKNVEYRWLNKCLVPQFEAECQIKIEIYINITIKISSCEIVIHWDRLSSYCCKNAPIEEYQCSNFKREIEHKYYEIIYFINRFIILNENYPKNSEI